MQVSIALSDKLKFLLGGYTKLGPYFTNKTDSRWDTTRTVTTHTIVSNFMGGASVGVNRMFFYCDKVQKSIVGDSKSSLLSTVPLKIKGQGNAEARNVRTAFYRKKTN